jgi:hypothetical protein
MKSEGIAIAGRVAAFVFCLALAGCGLISIGVSNSSDWCPNPQSKACP